MKTRRGLLVAALSAFWPVGAWACESCRNMLADDPAALGFSRGIYFSIVVMLGVVVSLVGAFVFFVVREARRGRAEESPGSGT